MRKAIGTTLTFAFAVLVALEHWRANRAFDALAALERAFDRQATLAAGLSRDLASCRQARAPSTRELLAATRALAVTANEASHEPRSAPSSHAGRELRREGDLVEIAPGGPMAPIAY